MDDKTKLKNSVLSNLRAVLVSVKGNCPLWKVAGDYHMLMGEEIPFKKLGYKTLLEFVTKENAFKLFKTAQGELMVDATPDIKSAHIVEMIQKQKSNKSRSKGGRSRRFAPVRGNTITTNTRMPSSQNNWRPQKLTPVKNKRPSSSYRRRPSRLSSATSINTAADRLKALQVTSSSLSSSSSSSSPPQNSETRDTTTIVYKGVKTTTTTTKDNSRHQHQQQSSAGGGDLNEEINNKKSIISRENSSDSTTTMPLLNNKTILSRQSSLSNNENNVVDLLKNVPKELLRDVPFDNNDLTFNEILDRTTITTCCRSSSNMVSTTTSSNLLLLKVSSSSPSPSSSSIITTTTDESSSISDVDRTSSNPTSPLINDASNNIKWSPISGISGITPLTTNTSNIGVIHSNSNRMQPRGRGRLLTKSLELASTVQSTSIDNNTIFNYQMNTKQFVDSTPPSMIIKHEPTTKLLSEQLLCDLMNELNLEYKIEYKIIKRSQGGGGGGIVNNNNNNNKKNIILYNAQIKIGGHVQCSTWPDEFNKSDDALDAIFTKAFEEVNKTYAYIRLPITTSSKCISERLRSLLIGEHSTTGIWSDTIEKIYTEMYNERLPNNWLCLCKKYGIKTECAPNEKFILTLMNEDEQVFDTCDNIDDLNNSISAPILPSSKDSNYISVVITCTHSTIDISFRVIGTSKAEQYKRLITVDMEQYYNNNNNNDMRRKPIHPKKISAGNYYAVSNNNTWMRVRVLEEPQTILDTTEVLCSFIDHGHEYPIQLNQLYELPYTFRSIEAQAIHCSLIGLEELSESEIAEQYLEELVGKHLFLKVIEDIDTDNYNSNINVVLFDTSDDDDVNININIMSKVCNDLNKTLKLSNNIKILEMNVLHCDNNNNDNNNNIIVYLNDNTNNNNNNNHLFNDLMDKLFERINESIYNNDITYITNVQQIILNEHLYLAKYNVDNMFYRCKFIKLNKKTNSGVALFIDYGNTIVINLNTDVEHIIDLSLYSHVLQNIPAQCIKALLHYNVSTLPTNNIGDTLMNLLIDTTSTILVKVLIPSSGAGDQLNELPVVELFTRKCITNNSGNGGINGDADADDDDDELYSINKVLGLLMREPKIEEVYSNNNNKEKIQKTQEQQQQQPLYDLTMFPSKSTYPSTGDLPQPKLPMDGTYFDVNIPSAVNPWNFFIQPYVDGKELKQFMLNLQDYYNIGPGSKRIQLQLNDIKAGECYVAQHYPDNTWYRACVNQTIDYDSISAFFVDYGQYVVLNSKQLQPLHNKFKLLPFQVLKARLSDIIPSSNTTNKWSVEDCRIFQDIVVGKQFVCLIKEISCDILHNSDNVLSVLLIDTTTNIDIQIHKLLIQKGIAKPLIKSIITTKTTTSTST